MSSPYKLSATQGIVDFQFPIADLKNPLKVQRFSKSAIGKWQSAITRRSLMDFF
jgi:hypothetical protein